MSKILQMGGLALFGLVLINLANADGSPPYVCDLKPAGLRAVLTKLVVVKGSPDLYFDARNLGRWKLDVRDREPEYFRVRLIRSGIDRPLTPIGSPRFQCSANGSNLSIYSNLAVEVCSTCVGPGRVTQFEIVPETEN